MTATVYNNCIGTMATVCQANNLIVQRMTSTGVFPKDQVGMARPGAAVRGMLVAPVKPGTEEARLIDEACYRAGMLFNPCPTMAELNASAARLISLASKP